MTKDRTAWIMKEVTSVNEIISELCVNDPDSESLSTNKVHSTVLLSFYHFFCFTSEFGIRVRAAWFGSTLLQKFLIIHGGIEWEMWFSIV